MDGPAEMASSSPILPNPPPQPGFSIRRKPVPYSEIPQNDYQVEDRVDTPLTLNTDLIARSQYLRSARSYNFFESATVSPVASSEDGQSDRFQSMSDDEEDNDQSQGKDGSVRMRSAIVSDRRRRSDEIGLIRSGSWKERKWNPIWLSVLVMGTFIAVFSLFLLVTGLLYYCSGIFEGISTQEPRYRYAWKYGPTMMILIVHAFWRQVDHTIKISIPWKELQQGPEFMEKAVRLDYVSPWLIVSLWRSLKNRHWAVALSVLGHALLIVATVFSTGLLVLTPTELTGVRSDFMINSEFRLMDDIQLGSEWAPGPAAAQLYYGIHAHDLHYPPGTSEDAVIPNIRPPNMPFVILNYTSQTEAMKVVSECEVLPVRPDNTVTSLYNSQARNSSALHIQFDVDTPRCAIKEVLIRAPYFFDSAETPPERATRYHSAFDWYACNTGVSSNILLGDIPNVDDNGYPTVISSKDDSRLLLTAFEFQLWDYNSEYERYLSNSITNITAVLCQMSHSIEQVEIQEPDPSNGAARITRSQGNQPGRQLENLSNSTINAATEATLRTFNVRYLDGAESGMFNLMGLKSGRSTIPPFLDSELLIETATSVLTGVATQLMHQLALQPTSQWHTGNVTYLAERLKVQETPTIVMCVSFGVLIMISIGIVYTWPDANVPLAPDSVARLAVLLSDDQYRGALNTVEPLLLVQSCQQFANPDFLRVAFQRTFSGSSLNFSKKRSKEREDPVKQQETESDAVSSWTTSSGTSWYFALILACPLIGIAVLEILQHLSDTRPGIVDLHPSSQMIFTTYLPTVAALSIAGLYHSLDFTARLFMPFIALKRGRATAARSLHVSFIGKLPPVAAYLALKAQHYAILTALLGSLIGGFLTIIASGLYAAVDVPRSNPIPLSQQGGFNLNIVDWNRSSGAPEIASLIEYQDMNYTRWTYEDLVFARLHQSTLSSTDLTHDASIMVKVPSIRPKLNCTEAKMELVHPSRPTASTHWNRHTLLFELNTTLVQRDWCETPVVGNDSLPVSWADHYLIPAPAYDRPGSIGLGKAITYFENPRPTSRRDARWNSIGHGCPSFAVTLGWAYPINSTARPTINRYGKRVTTYDVDLDVGTILCYQNFEYVETTASFQLPDFDLNPNQLPRPNESSTILHRRENGSPRFDYNLRGLTNGLLGANLRPRKVGDLKSLTDSTGLDRFVKTLLTVRDMHEIGGANNTANLSRATEMMYKRYMAQAMSLEMRTDDSDSAPLNTYDGVLTMGGRTRLKQDRSSKVALQIMLAVMIACAITTRIMLPLTGVLLSNPCSIAGTASLLVGGSLLAKQETEQFEQRSARAELAGRFQGSTYSLRWWKTANGMMRYGIDADHNDGGGCNYDTK